MLRSQEEFYLQGQYCNQCVDLDIFLLQVRAITGICDTPVRASVCAGDFSQPSLSLPIVFQLAGGRVL